MKCIAELNGECVPGKILRVERYRNMESENVNEEGSHSHTVYVRGLNKSMNQNEADECIKSILNGCGEIKEIRLIKDKKKLKGFGYVEFVEEKAVEKALKCNNFVYKNKVIQVLAYKSQERHKMDVDNGENDNNEVNRVSSDFVDKLAFKPRSVGQRKSKLTEKKITDENNKAFNQNILNKSNKSPDDFRKLFHI
eukprot:UN00150